LEKYLKDLRCIFAAEVATLPVVRKEVTTAQKFGREVDEPAVLKETRVVELFAKSKVKR